jgi:osmotically-inducible protein OsmY
MKILNLTFLALLASTSLSANSYGSYGYSSCQGGNCSYQGNQSQRNYPEASGQAYYNSDKSNYNSSRYGQGQYQGNYDRDQQYNRSQNREGYYDNRSGQNNRDGNDNRSSQNYDDRGMQTREGSYDNKSQNSGYYDNRDQQQNTGGYYNNRSQQTRDGYYDNSNRQYNDRNQYNRSGYQSRQLSDEEITKEVQNTVGSGWLSSGYPNVKYDVSNGTVTLRGSVKTQDDKNKIEDKIRKIDGVRQVNNQINVEEGKTSYNNRDHQNEWSNLDTKERKSETNYPQDTASSESDRVINEKLRDRLSGWFTKGFESITIRTSNGIVTITGVVDNPEDLEKINKEAKNVEGIKSVNNNASVNKK